MPIDWDQLYQNGREYAAMPEQLLNEALEAASAKPEAKILDVGCGKGDLAIMLAQRGFSVTGIDLSPTAVEAATHRSKDAGVSERTQFAVANIEKDPGNPALQGPYDLIFCKLVYAFIEDKSAFLDWVKAHLAEGGAFILVTPVLRDGIEYNQRLNNISTPLEPLNAELATRFGKVQLVHTDHFEDNGEEQTIVAHKLN